MQLRTFYAFFYSVTLFLLFFYSWFLITLKKKRTVSHILLAIFLSSLGLSYMHNVTNTFMLFFYENFPTILYIGISFELLTGPALYFYIRSITEPNFKLKKLYLLHTIPFLIHFSFFCYRFHFHSFEVQRLKIRTATIFTQNEMLYSMIFNHLHFIVYTALAIWLISRYRSKLKQSYSSLRGINLRWVVFISSGLIINWAYHFFNGFLWLKMQHLEWIHHVDARPFLFSTAFIFASVIVYKSLRKPEILFDSENSAIVKPTFTEEQKKQIQDRIMLFMENEKPYLDPLFDLTSFAKDVKVPKQHISQFLNHYQKQNFYDFVNTYRIRESQRLLSSSQANGKNITEIMYETGFNSKSVFYEAFKKTTGMTQAQFRKSAANTTRTQH